MIERAAMVAVMVAGLYAASQIWNAAHPWEPWLHSGVIWRKALRRMTGGRLGRIR